MPILDKTDKVQVEKYTKFLETKESVSLNQDFRVLSLDKNSNFEIVYLEKNGNITGTMALSIMPVGKKYSVLYSQGGPVCDVYNLNDVNLLVHEAKSVALKYNALMLVLLPEVEYEEKLEKLYKKKGFKMYSTLPFDFIKNAHDINMIVDLSQMNEDNVETYFNDKTKYYLETAQKREFQVKIGTTKREFNKFIKLYEQENMLDFQDVKKFETFKALLKEFDDDEIRVYSVSAKGKTVSSAIVSKCGNRIKCMGETYEKENPLAVFARAKMHLEIIKWGVNAGCVEYNMGKVDEEDNRLKEGFATKDGQVRFIGKICKVYNKFAAFKYIVRGKKI